MLEVKSVNVFTEEINKIALSSNDDKRMQSIDSIEAFADSTSNDLLWKKKKEELKCNNIIKQHKNVLLDYITKKDIKEHNPNWPKNPDHPYRIKIIRGSGSD